MSDQPLPNSRPLPSSFDENDDFYNESGLRKVVRRLREEPLVPIGALLTVAAFTNAYRAMRRGDHHKVQRMFRARVAAQAFTVVAMVAGGMYYAEDRHKQRELWKLKQQQEAEEKRQKWIRELEARDEEEKAFREKLDRRRKRAAERADQDTGTDGVAAQARAALREAKAAMPANAKQEATDSDPVEEEPSRAPDNGNKPKSGLLNSLNSLGGLFGRSKGTPEQPLQSPEDHRKPVSEK